ncbi:polymer-forming cytoskeletal protein [Candidatus Parcubacteria bacterium]|nr:polymer-forming cytoskeletal protein [Candidatus Parcubacteria bacterium]
MFKKHDQRENFKKVETIIGSSVKVKGDFNSQGNIIIEGIVQGNLKTKGNLLVGDKAKITADIEAKEAKISGEIKGNVKIKEYLELTATAKIFGDVEASSLSVERGAILNGKCTMIGEEKAGHGIEEKKTK